MGEVSAATQASFDRLLAVKPVLAEIARLGALLPELPKKTLFHAGPPFERQNDLPVPIVNAAAVAAVHEGFATDHAAAREAIASGDIALRPAQDAGIVTPLAFVAGPSMYGVAVVDANNPARRIAAPLNDGPPAACLRFGVDSPAGRANLRRLSDGVGADMAACLRTRVEMLPILSAALDRGDELHGQVAAVQAAIVGVFDDALADTSKTYLEAATQFGLNIVMATAALMLGAGAGVPGSTMVTACGGNGQRLGYQTADATGQWITVPATAPIGPKMNDSARALPAIGDSAVIDALGFGAACLRFAPTLAKSLGGWVDDAFFTPAAHAPFIGRHPAFPQDDLKLGLDIARPGPVLGIMLGMVEAGGTEGLMGRGVASWTP